MTDNDNPQDVNLQALAQRCRVSRQTVYNWRDAGCPVEDGYEAVKKWLKARRNRKNADSTTALARRRHAEAVIAEEKARALKRENAIAEGKSWDASEAAHGIAQAFVLIKLAVADVPEIAAGEVPPSDRAEVKARVEDHMYSKLIGLSHSQVVEGVTFDDAILVAAAAIQKRRGQSEPVAPAS